MGCPRVLAVPLLGLAGLALLAGPAAAVPPSEGAPADPVAVRAAVEKVLAERRFQKSLPSRPPPEESGGAVPEIPAPRPGAPVAEPAPPAEVERREPAGGWRYLLGGLVIAALLVAVLRAVRSRGPVPGPEGEQAAPAAPPPPPEASPDPLEVLDRMAAEGRREEALHGLLLLAIATLRGSLRTALPDELTSREILRRAPLGAAGAPHFARLVDGAERVHFGGRPASPEDYDGARASCIEVLAAVRRGRP